MRMAVHTDKFFTTLYYRSWVIYRLHRKRVFTPLNNV